MANGEGHKRFDLIMGVLCTFMVIVAIVSTIVVISR